MWLQHTWPCIKALRIMPINVKNSNYELVDFIINHILLKNVWALSLNSTYLKNSMYDNENTNKQEQQLYTCINWLHLYRLKLSYHMERMNLFFIFFRLDNEKNVLNNEIGTSISNKKSIAKNANFHLVSEVLYKYLEHSIINE